MTALSFAVAVPKKKIVKIKKKVYNHHENTVKGKNRKVGYR